MPNALPTRTPSLAAGVEAIGVRLRECRRGAGPGATAIVTAAAPVPALDPLTVYRAMAGHRRAYWAEPGDGLSFAAAGVAWTLDFSGPNRFAAAAQRWREIGATAAAAPEPGAPLTGPIALCGFGFDVAGAQDARWRGFPDGRLLVPALLLVQRGSETWLYAQAIAGDPSPALLMLQRVREMHREDLSGARSAEEPDSSAPRPGEPDGSTSADWWRRAVARTLEAIRAGEIEKLVLARRQVVRSPRPLDSGRLLDRLRARQQHETLFAVDDGSGCFLGATPERLLSLHAGGFSSGCLAGSAGRGAGAEEDRALGQRLQCDPKERREHAFVVRAVREALAPLCETLAIEERPELLRTADVQHLFTPVGGVARAGVEALDLVGRLHPSPAVGGVPPQAALRMICEEERGSRGWYAGPLGWLDRDGGAFVVGIRSALLRGSEATLYAGCGIVAGSDPDREWLESSLKLRTMQRALGVQ